MPQVYKGRRVKLTIRLPHDVHQEAALRAAARRWDMSTYIGWCVENQQNPARVRAAERRDPTNDHVSEAGLRSRRRRAVFSPDMSSGADG